VIRIQNCNMKPNSNLGNAGNNCTAATVKSSFTPLRFHEEVLSFVPGMQIAETP
jgi:hypothetical protein